MKERLERLIYYVSHPNQPWSDIEAVTGIARQRWRNACRGQQRVSQDMIEAVAEHWPEYLCWLIVGHPDLGVAQLALGFNAREADLSDLAITKVTI